MDTAIYCDIVNRFYTPGNVRSSNQWPPVGLTVTSPLPADSSMVKAAVARNEPGGEPTYARSIRRVSDTSQAEAVLRNGVTFSPESAIVLSAPATSLARSVDLAGAREQYAERVKRLVIVDSDDLRRDPAALRKLLVEWPTPIFFCGRDTGEMLSFPGARLDETFGWVPAHPIADAYRAFKVMPYDAPTHDLSAMSYTVNPGSGLFQVSAPGTLTVSDGGIPTFSPGSGQVRRITVEPSRRAEVLSSFVEILSSKPPPPPAPRKP